MCDLVNVVKALLGSKFDVRVRSPTNEHVRCSKNDVRVRSMFDKMVFDPSLPFSTFLMFHIAFISDTYNMESKTFRGTKNDFSYLVDMALQSRMPWNILTLNFNALAPTLNETKEIISILLKELEILHSTLNEKEKLLEEYQNSSDSFEETKTIVQENDTFEEIESIHEHDPLADTKLIEDSIEVPEG